MFGRERRRLRELFGKQPTVDLAKRAHDWPYLERYANAPCVRDLRALIDARRFTEIRRRWRKISLELFAVGNDDSPTHHEFYDSGTDVALLAMIEVLSERQEAGTLAIVEDEQEPETLAIAEDQRS